MENTIRGRTIFRPKMRYDAIDENEISHFDDDHVGGQITETLGQESEQNIYNLADNTQN